MKDYPADFRDLVVRRRDSCVKFKDGKPAADRKEAMQFYRGDDLPVYGDSGDGLSTVVSRDVMEAIESVMPPLLRPFVAGEEVVSFDPVEDADEDGAKQATEFVNHIFRRNNNVLHVAQNALKDGLLFRLGVAKTVMEEDEGSPEVFADLTQDELIAKRIELMQREQDVAGDIEQDQKTGLFTITVPAKPRKRYRVHIIAPDEFLYEERLSSLADASFLGHTKRTTLGDLIALGISEKDAKALGSGKPETSKSDSDQDTRFEDEGREESEWKSEDLARPVWLDECYIRCDYEKNGTLQWRKVLLGGSEKKLLTNEPADDHPYSTWTPIPIPHKLVGLSYFDLTRDVQINKTVVQREINNAMYLANRPMREIVDEQVNMADLLAPSVGGVVRVKAPGMIREIPSGGSAAFNAAFQSIEYFDSVREARTGVTRYNQGMDSNSLNKTATGMNIISSNSQQRQELVARQFGEFLKDVFGKLLDLATRNAKPEDVAKLTGSFVPWPTEYDTTVSVGLGTNNKDQLVGHLMALMQVDEKIIGLQQGIQGPLLTAPNIYEKLKRLTEAMGLKGTKYYTDPEDVQQQPPQQEEPPQDPLAEPKIKAETEIGKARIQADTKLQIAQMQQQPTVVPFPMVEGGFGS